MSGADLLGILGGLAGIIAVVVAVVVAVRGSGSTPEATWRAAIGDLRTELTSVKVKLDQTLASQALYKNEVDDLRGVVLVLTAQLRENGIEPRVAPQPRKPITGPLGGK